MCNLKEPFSEIKSTEVYFQYPKNNLFIFHRLLQISPSMVVTVPSKTKVCVYSTAGHRCGLLSLSVMICPLSFFSSPRFCYCLCSLHGAMTVTGLTWLAGLHTCPQSLISLPLHLIPRPSIQFCQIALLAK